MSPTDDRKILENHVEDSEQISPDLSSTAVRALEAQMQREIERAIFGDAAVSTSNVTNESTLDIRKMLPEWERMLRNARRAQVTFVVDRGHQGPPIRHETPNDGDRIELSWPDANMLHQQWPLRLHAVLSEDAAEFVPIMVGEYAPKILPMPPFEVPPDESFEDWLRGEQTDESS